MSTGDIICPRCGSYVTTDDIGRQVCACPGQDPGVFVAPPPSTGWVRWVEVMSRPDPLDGVLEGAFAEPELRATYRCGQNAHHSYDVWEHTLRCVEACPPDPVLRVAALLHDIGKPTTRTSHPKTGDIMFPKHEEVGAEMAAAILDRWQAPDDAAGRVVGLVRHHYIRYDPSWSDTAVRRWATRVGDLAGDLFILARADVEAKGKAATRYVDEDLIGELKWRISRLDSAKPSPGMAIDGDDVMRVLGIGAGPRVGAVLKHLADMIALGHLDPDDREGLLAEAGKVPSWKQE